MQRLLCRALKLYRGRSTKAGILHHRALLRRQYIPRILSGWKKRCFLEYVDRWLRGGQEPDLLDPQPYQEQGSSTATEWRWQAKLG